MAERTAFKIVAPNGMAVYDKVGGSKIGKIPKNIVFEVDGTSRTEHLGSVYWKFQNGWCIEKTVDGATVILEAVGDWQNAASGNGNGSGGGTTTTASSGSSTTTTTSNDGNTTTTTASNGGNTTTATASSAGTSTTTTTDDGTTTTTTTTDDGETTEQTVTIDTGEVTAEVTVKITDEDAPDNELVSKLAGKLAKVKAIANLRAKGSVKVRDAAGGTQTASLSSGDIVVADINSLLLKNGHYWVEHSQGWSAIQNISGDGVYFEDAGDVYVPGPDGPKVEEMPGYQSLITRHPVDLADTNFFQYFGNNSFAYVNGRSFNYHSFAQGLHSGLDYGSNGPSGGIKVYAGVHGTYTETLDDWKGRVWNKQVRITTEEGYLLIYQHIDPASFQPGQEITPDTVVGTINASFPSNGDHLHWEIRYNNQAWIVNPLAFMKPELVDEIVAKFNPERPGTGYSGSKFYYFFIT
ncbi:MAG: M23 family metallopeptidase, partial [Chloroflexota bacterium]